MQWMLEAACGCSIGLVRNHNEDNFLFDNQILPVNNQGLDKILCIKQTVRAGTFLGVFDGVGGKVLGEAASFAAAEAVRHYLMQGFPVFRSEAQYLNTLCQNANAAVFHARPDKTIDGMYTTLAGVCFGRKKLWICNVGDSKVLRVRNNQLELLSKDHTNREYLIRQGITSRKPSLTQYLGFDPNVMQLSPYIADETLHRGDRYLICSDGLTDMLDSDQIWRIMIGGISAEDCVQTLMTTALEQGGKDNLTIIVLEVT